MFLMEGDGYGIYIDHDFSDCLGYCMYQTGSTG